VKTREIVGVLTAAVLASTMIGAVSGPAEADADGTVVGRAAVRGKPLVRTVRDVPMAVTSDGTTLLAATTAGLTKYAVTRHSVKLLGTNRTVQTDARRDLEILPGGRFAYVTYTRPYPEKYSAIQVFNLRRDRPRLVRTMKFRSLGVITDTVVSPDGRLFLSATDKIKVLDLTRPGHPVRAGSITEEGAVVLAVTPDGSRLVTAPLVLPREEADLVRVWDISSPEATVLERQGAVPVPQSEGNGSWIKGLAVSPDGEGLYVESYYCDVECEDSYPSLARLRLSDLSTESRVERAWGTPFDFLAGLTPGGGKVFVRTGYTTDEPETKPRGLSWLDPDLAVHHEVAHVGNVRGVAVSPGGRTRGMVFAAGRKAGKLRIYAVRF
jgi:WD40 repeat protein